MLERDAWSKESVRMVETSLAQLKRVGISVVSHRRRQMLMHKIGEDFGPTENVEFVTFAWLLRSLVWMSM